MAIDIEKVKDELGYMTSADHMGDINNSLPRLCEALDLPQPTWCDPFTKWVMAWDTDDHADGYESHSCDVTRAR